MASQHQIHLGPGTRLMALLKCRKNRMSVVALMFVGFFVTGVAFSLFHAVGPMRMVLVDGGVFQKAASRVFIQEAPCDTSCKRLREQVTRAERISTTCTSYKNTTTGADLKHELTPKSLKRLTHVLVLDSHKLIYCYIPKVGCTNWKRILLVLRGIYNDTKMIGQAQTHTLSGAYIKPLSKYSLSEVKERLANYTKFMFVRHPLERILSGYRDKFQKDYPSSTDFRKNFGPKIATYGDQRKVPLRPDGTLNVTFGQFIRYIGDSKNSFSNEGATEHWNDMYKMCQPCMINYDIIGNFSSMYEDANFTLQAAGLNGKISYPKSTNPTNSSNEAHMTSYFADLPPADIRSLLTRFVIDMDLFGFAVPASLNAVLNNVTDGWMSK